MWANSSDMVYMNGAAKDIDKFFQCWGTMSIENYGYTLS